jgi:hypothetical protein
MDWGWCPTYQEYRTGSSTGLLTLKGIIQNTNSTLIKIFASGSDKLSNHKINTHTLGAAPGVEILGAL